MERHEKTNFRSLPLFSSNPLLLSEKFVPLPRLPHKAHAWSVQLGETYILKADNLKDFRAKKHIRGVRLHFLPESYEGTQALYEGITFEKAKND